MNKLPDKVAAGEETEVQLAPWGVYRNRNAAGETVDQIVDETAGRAIVAYFEASEPPEEILVDADHGSETDGSTEAMAWITALRTDPETGLWATFKWTDKGADAVSARRFRFVSPAWHVDEGGRPDALSSVALTNKPNIPGKPILNRESAGGASADQPKKTKMEELKKALGLAPDADDAAVLAAVQALAQKVTDLEAAKLNSEADAFAEEHKDKAKDPEVLRNAYKKDPELAKSLVLNMKDPAPAPAPEPAKKPGEVETAATRILTNRAPVGPGAGLSKEQAREKLASLPESEQAEFYRQNAALIDG